MIIFDDSLHVLQSEGIEIAVGGECELVKGKLVTISAENRVHKT